MQLRRQIHPIGELIPLNPFDCPGHPPAAPGRACGAYFLVGSRSSTAADMAITPVAMVVSGVGKYSAEWSEGRNFLSRTTSSIRDGAIEPSRNMKIGTPARPYWLKS